LFRADDRSLAFTDRFHRPVACTGPARFVEAPVWHLDTVLASREERLRKALRYERARRGMRIGAFSHNTGLYVPELRGSLELADVPPRELATIKEILLAPARRVGGSRIEEPSPAEVEREWPGPPHPPTLYDASISLLGSVPPLYGGVQQTIDVRIENQGDCIWRCGEGAITLGTRWDGVEGIRTSLPADVLPADSVVVPLHVVPPAEAGQHVLEVDLVHEDVRWFHRTLRVDTTVTCRRRVLLAGRESGLQATLDAISLVPELEPLLLVEPEDADLGHLRVQGIGSYLFGPNGLDGTDAVPRAFRLVRQARGRRDGPDGARAFLDALDESECLIVVDDDVRPGAPPSRDRWRTLTVVAAARARGIPVWRVGSAERACARVDRVLQRAISRRAQPVELSVLPGALAKSLH
jgi:hypothetical protein